MKIYLDTSILRGLPVGAMPSAEAEWFTSALTAVELLERIGESEEQYLRRRPALRAFSGGPFIVDWTLPDVSAAMSFAALRRIVAEPDPRVDFLRRSVEAAAASETSEEFERRLGTDGLSEGLRGLFTAFGRYTAEPRGLAQDGRAAVLNFAGAAPDADQSREGRATRRKLKEDLSVATVTPEGRALSCRVLAKTLSISLNLSIEDGEIEKLVASYDHSLDPYLAAHALTAIAWPLDGSGPSDNSVLDIEHLTYIRPGVALATRDARMREIASRSGAEVIDFDQVRSKSAAS